MKDLRIIFVSSFLVLVAFEDCYSQFRLKQYKDSTIATVNKKGFPVMITIKNQLLKKLNSQDYLSRADSLAGYYTYQDCQIQKINGQFVFKLSSKDGETYVTLNQKNRNLVLGNVACYSKSGKFCKERCIPISDQCPFCDSCQKLCY